MENIQNNKGFRVLKLSKSEAAYFNFGITTKDEGYICICMFCNKDCTPDINYIAVLNDTACNNCYEEWLNDPDTKRYKEDIPYEERYYNKYAKIEEK